MKKILIILVSLLLLGYLVFSFFYFRDSSKKQVCSKFEVVVKDSSQMQFVRPSDVERLVKRHKLYPVGKQMSDINTLAILDTILTNKLIKSAEVYTTQSGGVIVNIHQREPMLRVMSDAHGSFYIDNNRERMPASSAFSAYVPLVTGAVDEDFAKNELFDFVQFLADNPEWDAWVEQIVVKPNKDVEIIPRVGDFKIMLGKLDNFSDKLSRFSLFIEKGLNKVGWNRYSMINLKYDNQIVCTKK